MATFDRLFILLKMAFSFGAEESGEIFGSMATFDRLFILLKMLASGGCVHE